MEQRKRESMVSRKLEKLSLSSKSLSSMADVKKLNEFKGDDQTSINETVAPTEQTKLIKKEGAEVVCR